MLKPHWGFRWAPVSRNQNSQCSLAGRLKLKHFLHLGESRASKTMLGCCWLCVWVQVQTCHSERRRSEDHNLWTKFLPLLFGVSGSLCSTGWLTAYHVDQVGLKPRHLPASASQVQGLRIPQGSQFCWAVNSRSSGREVSCLHFVIGT